MTFDRFAAAASRAAGRPGAFMVALGVVVVWAVTGPVFHYSDTWQLVINTGTTVITFLMVFLVQATQNRDAAALHLKVDELVRVTDAARNEIMRAEEKTPDQIVALREG